MARRDLSKREKEVTLLMAAGLRAKEIGTQLGISHRTVQVHRLAVYNKLNLRNKAHLIRYWYENMREAT